MKLVDLAKNDVQQKYARIIEKLCKTLDVSYEIKTLWFGVDITIKTTHRRYTIYCSESSCLDEFSKFLQGYIFALDIAREKYNNYL